MNRLTLSTAIGLFISGLTPALADTTYSFTSVADPADVTFTQLLGVNDAGAIAGYFGSGATGHPNQGFTLALPSTFSAENYPASMQTQVIGIDSVANTAGFYIDNAGTTHGFADINGSFATVDFAGTTFNQLLSLNDKGEAAGYYQDAAGTFHPYTWQNGTFTAVNFAGLVSAQATGVNNEGVIVGFNQTSMTTATGFILDGTALTTLVFPGAPMTQGLGINNSGQVVGSYVDANGNTHGFLYTMTTGTYQAIDDPNTTSMTIVNGLNDQGEIVGFYLDGSGNTVGLVGTPTSVTQNALAAAVLPGSRAVLAGAPATVFATMLNATNAPLTNCQISLPDWDPTGLTLSYQTTNPANNTPTGSANTPVNIPASGAQSFLISLGSAAALTSPATALTYSCDGGATAPLIPGVDTVDLVYSATPIADVIALAATMSNNGIVTVPESQNQPAAFAVASFNAGADATLTVTADTGNSTEPVALTICQSNPSNGQCLAAPAASVQLDVAPDATPTFSVFVTASAPIAFSPGIARVFVRFTDGQGVSHGATSVALATD